MANRARWSESRYDSGPKSQKPNTGVCTPERVCTFDHNLRSIAIKSYFISDIPFWIQHPLWCLLNVFIYYLLYIIILFQFIYYLLLPNFISIYLFYFVLEFHWNSYYTFNYQIYLDLYIIFCPGILLKRIHYVLFRNCIYIYLFILLRNLFRFIY